MNTLRSSLQKWMILRFLLPFSIVAASALGILFALHARTQVARHVSFFATLNRPLTWLIFSSLFFGIGEYFSKRWGMHPTMNLYIAVMAANMISVAFWMPAILQKNHLAITGTAWLLIGMVMVLTIGLIIFRETLSPSQWVGMGLAVIALTLLNV